MRLKSVRLRNFRGFRAERTVDLDGQVVLFYGPNGRGKSTIFSALELALFPSETLAEYRREMGDRAPLTNLWEEERVGSIRVALAGAEGQEEFEQKVRQELYSMAPGSSPLVARLAGQRYRLFFTQRLLRDLMFGMPERRHERVKQLLGCDGYDGLTRVLYEWHRDRDFELGQLQQNLRVLTIVDRDIQGRLSLALRDLPMLDKATVVDALDRRLPQMAYAAIRRYLGAIDREAMDALWRERPPYTLGDVLEVVTGAFRSVQSTYSVLSLLNDVPHSVRRRFLTNVASRRGNLPPAWLATLTGAQKKLETALQVLIDRSAGRLDLEMVSRGGVTAAGQWLLELETISNAEAEPARAAFEAALKSEQAFEDQVHAYRGRAKRLADELTRVRRGVEALAQLDEVLTVVDRVGPESGSTTEARNTLERRLRLVTFTRALYRTVLELTDETLRDRLALIMDRWNMFYQSIGAFSHFQHLDVELTGGAPTRADSDYWSIPPEKWSLIRLRVRDLSHDFSTAPFAMESLLSEGQLNCAVVSLALALSGPVGGQDATPFRLIALDDPFVSWDDVNMENFMLALRELAASGTTVLLSACDQRVVYSLRKNMESAPLERPVLIYTLTGWDKRLGPSWDRQEIRREPAAISYLSELPAGEFQGEEFESGPAEPEARNGGVSRVKTVTTAPAMYYILSTYLPECRERLKEEHRFDHLYLRQPDTRAFLEKVAWVPVPERPPVYFIFFDRVPESPTHHQLGDVYQLQDVWLDSEAGSTKMGHDKYSLSLKKMDYVGRPFTPGTALWESLLTTRGKRLGDFYRLNGRVLIPISAAEYNEILGLR